MRFWRTSWNPQSLVPCKFHPTESGRRVHGEQRQTHKPPHKHTGSNYCTGAWSNESLLLLLLLLFVLSPLFLFFPFCLPLFPQENTEGEVKRTDEILGFSRKNPFLLKIDVKGSLLMAIKSFLAITSTIPPNPIFHIFSLIIAVFRK